MDRLKLEEMTSKQLKRLFTERSAFVLSERAKPIIDELEKRGYIFDISVGDFITCQEWNARHGTHMLLDCVRSETVILTARIAAILGEAKKSNDGP